MSNINTLKSHLGIGIGSRKNKFLIELPMRSLDGEKINALAKSASLPERKINPVKIMHKGRQYYVRGETEYPGTYQITVLDDSEMNVRKAIDDWLTEIDDSAKTTRAGLGSSSFEKNTNNLLGILQSGKNIYSDVRSALNDPSNAMSNTLVGMIDPSQKSPSAKYQVDINIWQLSSNGQKVYGYKLQNAFPINVGAVTYEDSDQNTLTEFTVEFAYSEFLPLENRTALGNIATVDGRLSKSF